MELPWQDISTLKDYEGDLKILAWNTAHGVYVRTNKDDVISANLIFTHWCPITPPVAPAVEVPVEPEMVEPQKLTFDRIVEPSFCGTAWYYDFPSRQYKDDIPHFHHLKFDLSERRGKGIWGTDPTAWLAHKAKQEGNQHE